MSKPEAPAVASNALLECPFCGAVPERLGLVRPGPRDRATALYCAVGCFETRII